MMLGRTGTILNDTFSSQIDLAFKTLLDLDVLYHHI